MNSYVSVHVLSGALVLPGVRTGALLGGAPWLLFAARTVHVPPARNSLLALCTGGPA